MLKAALLASFWVAAFASMFGNGLAGIQVCNSPIVVLNHTLSNPSILFGVADHFWSTGPDDLWMDYYVDGEATPSISFQPPMAAGQGFQAEAQNDPINPGGLFSAGGKTGKGGSVGGWYVTWRIPFYKSLLVQARMATGCAGTYIIVRGYEQNIPLQTGAQEFTLPSGFVLPYGARLQLQALYSVTLPPLWPAALANVTFGYSGLLLGVTIAISSSPPANNYIEGCWHITTNGGDIWPGITLGTGFEDFFNSAYWFGAASGFPNGILFSHPNSGLTHFSRGAPTGSVGMEQLSAYRYFDGERVLWDNGGQLLWRVGDETSKCTTNGTFSPIGTPSAATISSYAWLYTWPNGQPVQPLPSNNPSYMSYTCQEDKCVPVPNPSGQYWNADCDTNCSASPPGPPAIVGCADGTCDAFCTVDSVRGCDVSWAGQQSLRAAPTGKTPGCGGSIPCGSPADACGPGWAVCLSDFTNASLSIEAFRGGMDASTCSGGDDGRYGAAVSHATPAWETLPPAPCPASATSADNGCAVDGWGAEPVCCGAGCTQPSCPSYVWINGTRIHVGENEGCGSATSDYLDGVLCCKA